MDINKLEPGFYILECREGIGYDEGLFHWTKGNKYRMKIIENGDIAITCDDKIFSPSGNRFEEMMKKFIIKKDLFNKKGIVEDFLERRNTDDGFSMNNMY
ncbi:MAG: hypothetical protein ACYDEX_19475 [Mobilitalea sp.]